VEEEEEEKEEEDNSHNTKDEPSAKRKKLSDGDDEERAHIELFEEQIEVKKQKIAKACEEIKQRLHLSYDASSLAETGPLVGREEEETVLKQFWERTVVQNVSGAIYISGAPGTGKTASVSRLLREKTMTSSSSSSSSLADPFLFFFFNCMSLKQSTEIFQALSELFRSKHHNQYNGRFIEKSEGNDSTDKQHHLLLSLESYFTFQRDNDPLV